MRCLARVPGAGAPAADEPGQTSSGQRMGRASGSSMPT